MIYPSFAKARHADKPFIVIDWHDARNNGAGNANLSTVINKFQKHVSIIK